MVKAKKLNVYYCSDIHNDYHARNALLDLTGDVDAVLVVAGDINSKGRTVRDLEEVADRWLAVIAVPGNHDWWGLALHERHKFKSELDNVHVLLEDWVVIKDVTFVGTTLWHEVEDWHAGMIWKESMNDQKKIRGHNWCRLQGHHIHSEHVRAVKFIEDAQRVINGKKILITHHAMCSKSIDERYVGQSSNRFYYTNLPHLLEGFDFHIHGHVHQEFDYEVYDCNVVCNPHAYGSENDDYGIRILSI
ncbi:calcineurin-like phosphoesterase superfamily domain protein [Vibrio phage 1.081.O._10N.286.52.C2]|nr:calcineurin-like phosphoesterase superfamily domain protein [Vibrio phage 1.081.O._10N.286.52.C2]